MSQLYAHKGNTGNTIFGYVYVFYVPCCIAILNIKCLLVFVIGLVKCLN